MENLKNRHRKWLDEEDGMERPTHLVTLLQPEQKARIEWLKDHCFGGTEILDIGCNRGYILKELKGKTGVDINPENIELATREYPQSYFMVGNVVKGLPFESNSYAIVIMTDILEHLEYPFDVWKALIEGLRIARKRLLITLPYRKTYCCALCFKHKWLVDMRTIGFIIKALIKRCRKVNISTDGNFLYLEVVK